LGPDHQYQRPGRSPDRLDHRLDPQCRGRRPDQGLTRTEKTGPLVAARAAAAGVTAEEIEKSLAANIVIGRIVDAHEIANIAAFLASPLSAAITGDAIAAGGGTRGAIHY
jgi:hypothetical protein